MSITEKKLEIATALLSGILTGQDLWPESHPQATAEADLNVGKAWLHAERLLLRAESEENVEATRTSTHDVKLEAERITAALSIIGSYGQIDGSHHQAWVIDQVARALLGDAYDAFIIGCGDWDTGIAP